MRDVAREGLDLGAILSAYTAVRGFPPYEPGMTVALTPRAYSQRIRSARRGSHVAARDG